MLEILMMAALSDMFLLAMMIMLRMLDQMAEAMLFLMAATMTMMMMMVMVKNKDLPAPRTRGMKDVVVTVMTDSGRELRKLGLFESQEQIGRQLSSVDFQHTRTFVQAPLRFGGDAQEGTQYIKVALSYGKRSGSSTTAELIGVTDAIKVSWKPLEIKNQEGRVLGGIYLSHRLVTEAESLGERPDEDAMKLGRRPQMGPPLELEHRVSGRTGNFPSGSPEEALEQAVINAEAQNRALMQRLKKEDQHSSHDFPGMREVNGYREWENLDAVFQSMGPNPLVLSEDLGPQVSRGYQHTMSVARDVARHLPGAKTPADQILNLEMLRMFYKDDPSQADSLVRPVVCKDPTDIANTGDMVWCPDPPVYVPIANMTEQDKETLRLACYRPEQTANLLFVDANPNYNIKQDIWGALQDEKMGQRKLLNAPRLSQVCGSSTVHVAVPATPGQEMQNASTAPNASVMLWCRTEFMLQVFCDHSRFLEVSRPDATTWGARNCPAMSYPVKCSTKTATGRELSLGEIEEAVAMQLTHAPQSAAAPRTVLERLTNRPPWLPAAAFLWMPQGEAAARTPQQLEAWAATCCQKWAHLHRHTDLTGVEIVLVASRSSSQLEAVILSAPHSAAAHELRNLLQRGARRQAAGRISSTAQELLQSSDDASWVVEELGVAESPPLLGAPSQGHRSGVLDLLLQQVSRTPHSTAIIADSGGMLTRLSYAELAACAAETSDELLFCCPAPAAVGVIAGRGAEAAVALVAALLSGAAYCPLDPAQPFERVAILISMADLDAVLVDAEHHGLSFDFCSGAVAD
eukprot:s2180_g3.t2